MQFFESSLADLYQSAVDAFPRTTMRQYATHPIIIANLRWTPFVGMKTLFIKGLAQNEAREYGPTILIKGINYGSGITITASDGMEYSFERPSLKKNDVLLRCDCKDFYWRFNYYNHLDRSLYGTKRRKYENKGGPPANPFELPGMCKHLMKTMNVLQEAGLFEEDEPSSL